MARNTCQTHGQSKALKALEIFALFVEVLNDLFLTHTARWETGCVQTVYDQESYRYDYSEMDSEKHYGSRIDCKRCRQIRRVTRGFSASPGLSGFGWLAVLTVAGFVAYVNWPF